METLFWIAFAIPSILIASTIHEYAHGLAAYRLGDATAKAEGRLTLNPLAHIDPIGAICMILFRFGWSKPVPINEYNFTNREVGTALTALAGPFSNFLVAALCSLLNLFLNLDPFSIFSNFLITFTVINLALAFFNLIPLPPLDGHKIVRAILPKKLKSSWENLEKFQLLFIAIIIIPITVHGSLASLYMSWAISFSLDLLGFL